MIRPWAGLRVAVLALAAALSGTTARAVDCSDLQVGANGFTICEARASEDIRLFLRDASGAILGHFSRVEELVQPKNQTLLFAMNAGMFHPDRSPVGLYVEEFQQEMRVVPNAGPGNFGMLPNGVFCIRNGRADVIETRRFIASDTACRFATQSGPMLVIDGELHPRFLPDSSSRFVRNGVGTSDDGQRVVFAISHDPVTFHEFARVFRDTLSLPQALYFDGKVSRLLAPQVGRDDLGFPVGPIVGILGPRN